MVTLELRSLCTREAWSYRLHASQPVGPTPFPPTSQEEGLRLRVLGWDVRAEPFPLTAKRWGWGQGGRFSGREKPQTPPAQHALGQGCLLSTCPFTLPWGPGEAQGGGHAGTLGAGAERGHVGNKAGKTARLTWVTPGA